METCEWHCKLTGCAPHSFFSWDIQIHLNLLYNELSTNYSSDCVVMQTILCSQQHKHHHEKGWAKHMIIHSINAPGHNRPTQGLTQDIKHWVILMSNSRETCSLSQSLFQKGTVAKQQNNKKLILVKRPDHSSICNVTLTATNPCYLECRDDRNNVNECK